LLKKVLQTSFSARFSSAGSRVVGFDSARLAILTALVAVQKTFCHSHANCLSVEAELVQIFCTEDYPKKGRKKRKEGRKEGTDFFIEKVIAAVSSSGGKVSVCMHLDGEASLLPLQGRARSGVQTFPAHPQISEKSFTSDASLPKGRSSAARVLILGLPPTMALDKVASFARLIVKDPAHFTKAANRTLPSEAHQTR